MVSPLKRTAHSTMRFLTVFFVAIAFAVAACQSPPTDDATASPFPEGGEPVVTVASTTQIARLSAALPDSLSITRAYAVRSETHEWAHYLAAKLRGGTVDDSVAIWFMQDGMDVPSDSFAVNALARSVSALPPFPDVAPDAVEAHSEIVALRAFTKAHP